MNEAEIDLIFEKYPAGQRDNLISILQDVQAVNGYIPVNAVIKISRFLKMPTVKIFSVASYYDQFRFEPAGKVNIKVCRGTSCHINQSALIISEIEKYLTTSQGDKGGENMFNLEIVSCMGACGKGPVFSIADNYYTSAKPGMVKSAIDNYREKHNI